jgi:hypothetical protein
MAPTDEMFSDDAAHPIPLIEVCDVMAVRKDGGADLMIVVSEPLMSDLRSRHRLIKKIETYLGYIASAEFKKECGEPSEASVSITVHIHPDSDPSMFELIEKCRGWIADNHASLVVKKRGEPATSTNAGESTRFPITASRPAWHT